MKKNKILIVEDDSTLAFIIQDALEREGFDVVSAPNGYVGLQQFDSENPDLVIADVMMPKMDGFEMVRKIRMKAIDKPVLFLTARTSLDDVVKGFELGANDYIRKPFQILELVVRIRALLNRRHVSHAENRSFELGDCILDFSSQRLTVSKTIITLTHIEATILNELFTHHDEVVEANKLMMLIWSNDDYNNLNRLHGFIYKLRKYLAKSSNLDIINARGIGYKLTTKKQA